MLAGATSAPRGTGGFPEKKGELRGKVARWQQSPREQQQRLHGKNLPGEMIPEGRAIGLLEGETTEKNELSQI